MQRNKIYAVTTLAQVAIELGEDEDFLFDLTGQMDTEDGVTWVYGTDDQETVITLSNDGIDCLRNIIAEHRRSQYFPGARPLSEAYVGATTGLRSAATPSRRYASPSPSTAAIARQWVSLPHSWNICQ